MSRQGRAMDHARIRSSLEEVLEERGYEPGERRRDIAFHLTDWLKDLEEWTAFCESPGDYDAEAVEKLVTGFLIHVPNHLAAASKLMLDIPVSDIFEIGAVDAET